MLIESENKAEASKGSAGQRGRLERRGASSNCQLGRTSPSMPRPPTRSSHLFAFHHINLTSSIWLHRCVKLHARRNAVSLGCTYSCRRLPPASLRLPLSRSPCAHWTFKHSSLSLVAVRQRLKHSFASSNARSGASVKPVSTPTSARWLVYLELARMRASIMRTQKPSLLLGWSGMRRVYIVLRRRY